MKKLALTLVCILGIISLMNAQDTFVVLDEQTNSPIESVSISLLNKRGGTLSDGEGRFTINKLPSINQKDTLYLSHIAYVTIKIAVSDLPDESNHIYMQALSQPITQVTVTGKQNLQDEIKYEELTPLKEGLFSFGAAMYDNKIYVIGGDNTIKDEKLSGGLGAGAFSKNDFILEKNSNKLMIYDIPKDTWEVSDQQFTKRAYHNVHYYNGKLYVLGGKKLAKNPKLEYLNQVVEVYDINRDTLITDKTNPHQAVNFASALFENNIIMMGGSVKNYPSVNRKLYSDKAYLFNLDSGLWYEMENIPYAKETKGILIGDIFYLIGGHRNTPLKYIDGYNIKTGDYQTYGNLLENCERPALCHYKDLIYIFENGNIQTYNINTHETLLYPIALRLTASEMFYKNGKLYILGGCTKKEESVFPSEKLISIEISEFNKTRKRTLKDI